MMRAMPTLPARVRTLLRPCACAWLLASIASCATTQSSNNAAQPAPAALHVAPPAPPAAAEGAPAPSADETPPVGMLPRTVRPTAYWLELEIVPTRDRFNGHVRVAVDLSQGASGIWIHGENLAVQQVRAEQDGRRVAAQYRQVDDNGLSRLTFAAPLAAGKAVLDFVYDAPFDRQLSGLYRVDSDGASYAFTQFETISARKAFPCFDEPGWKTPFDVTLVVPADQAAIGNTPERSSEVTAAGLRRVRFAVTRPLPTYLLAFVVGPLDVVEAAPVPANAVRRAPLPLRGVAQRGRGARMRYALDHTAALVTELERYFGIAYPFEKLDLIAVPDFSAGAMENAGAITFREQILLIDPQSAPESQLRRFENVTAHELAHHWTGDLVTMNWWDDTWLNEAFATFMATRTVAAVSPEANAQEAQLAAVHAVMDGDSHVSARKIRQPILSTHDIANAFDGITYQKGAGVLAMFERFLGPEVFRAGVQRYLRAHAFGNATSADLLAALSQVSGKDVATAMGGFLDQEGVPLVHAAVRCGEGKAALALRQERYLPAGSTGSRDQRWQVPVCARYAVRGQLAESCALLTDVEGSLPLRGCPDWVLPNADGAGYYRWSLPAGDLDKLRSAGFAKLDAREQLSFADALRSGFESGTVTAQSLLAALPLLARAAPRSLAAAPLGTLRFLREYVLAPEDRPAFDRYARGLYAPRLQKLGWRERANDSGDDKLLRADLVAFLALDIQDPATRRTAQALGRRYIEPAPQAPAKPAPDTAPPDMRTALAVVAMQQADGVVFDAVRARFGGAEDPIERDRLLYALSAVRDARSSRVLELPFDPALRVNEMFTPLRVQLDAARTRDAAWTFFAQNLDALIARAGRERAGGLPWMAGAFCSDAMADRVQALFAPRIDQLLGGPRALAGVVESLHLCVAAVELQRASARAFFVKAR
jgi:alanyl aminopeptidase